MESKGPLVGVLFVIVIVLAFVLLVMGLFTDGFDPDGQVLEFRSDEGRTQPEGGYLTPVYDPFTTVTVNVVATGGGRVEVLLFQSTYRGGRVIENEFNRTVIRDEYLAAGTVDERTGQDVELKASSHVTASYLVEVHEPGSRVPSDTAYTITISASTISFNLIFVSIGLFCLVFVMGIYLRVYGRTEPPTGGPLGPRPTMMPGTEWPRPPTWRDQGVYRDDDVFEEVSRRPGTLWP